VRVSSGENMKTDANKIARENGPEALRAVFDTGKPRKPEANRRSAKPTAAVATAPHDPDLLEFNNKYAVVQVTGKTRVVFFDDEKGIKLPVFQTLADFKAFHANRRKSLQNSRGTSEVGIGEWWLRHPERRQYEAIGYYPLEDDPKRLNLWNGFACDERKGDCSLYLQHVEQNICAGVAEHFQYLLNWMAHCVQHPGRQAGSAIVLKGKEGVGKGAFVTTFGRCFGAHFRHVTHGRHLTGNFNSHLQQCTLLFADEAFFAGDRTHESVLKSLITEDTIQIEPKGFDLYSVRNCIHLLMASNNEWVVPAGADARRFFVLDVADTQMQNTEYFAAIDRQMRNGGQEALLWDLRHRDISKFEPRKVPQTAALAQQKQFSRRGIDQLIEIIAQEGALPNAHARYPNVAVTTGEERGQGFWAYVRKLVPDLKHQSSAAIMNNLKKNWACDRYKSNSTRGVRFPPLAELRRLFDDRHGEQSWPDPQAEWDELNDLVDGDASAEALR
jgi:hypothetical protein